MMRLQGRNKMGAARERTERDTIAIGDLGDGDMNTYPRIGCAFSTEPALAAGKRAATTGTVR